MSRAVRVALTLLATASFSAIAAALVSPVHAADPPYTGILISDEGGGVSRANEALVDLDPGAITGTFGIGESFGAKARPA